MDMNLRQMRETTGITQAEMAKKFGVSRPTYSQIEKGEKEPTVSQAKIIAELFRKNEKPKLLQKTPSKGNAFFSSDKFKEVLLYILEKIGARPHVGETVLYKLLYFIDFDYFEKTGKKLIGATYIKNRYGPTPVEFKKIVEAMIQANELEPVNSRYFKYDQKKYLPRRSADLNLLDALEIKMIDGILERLGDKNAQTLSAYSHGDAPWQVAQDGKAIQYELVWDREPPYTEHNYLLEWAEAGAADALIQLPPLTKEEYDYYMNLKDDRETR